MKNTNTKDFNELLKAHLIPIIEDKARDYDQTIEGNPFKWVIDVARSEVGHEFERNGDQGGLEYWLSGLGMNIEYNYYGIIRTAEKLHECKLTEKEADRVCENWFRFIASKIMQYASV